PIRPLLREALELGTAHPARALSGTGHSSAESFKRAADKLPAFERVAQDKLAQAAEIDRLRRDRFASAARIDRIVLRAGDVPATVRECGRGRRKDDNAGQGEGCDRDIASHGALQCMSCTS